MLQWLKAHHTVFLQTGVPLHATISDAVASEALALGVLLIRDSLHCPGLCVLAEHA